MASIINTNIASLTARNNLSQTQSALNTAIERLSSGLRINSAKDDAAGLAISQRFTTQINGLNQAVRNANDAISFAQTAEGALGTIGDSLQRIRQLAVQAANDTNSASDRQAINNEVQELISEINRVANSTQFNGQNVLDGSAQNLVFQVGANQGQTISVDGVDARGSELGAFVAEGNTVATSKLQEAADGGDTLTINGFDVDLSTIEADGVADTDLLVDAINKLSSDSGVTAQKATSVEGTLTYTADSEAREIEINNVTISLAANATRDDVVEAINAVSAQTGVEAKKGSAADEIDFSSTSSADVVISEAADPTATGAAALFTELNGDGTAAASETYQAGVVLSTDVADDPNNAITLGYTDGDTTVGSTEAAVGLSGLSGSNQVLNAVNVLTRQDASDALATVDYALQQINGQRAQLGAVQNRFDSTISNLEISAQNLTAARSRIRDADFAQETANLTRAQILQQAGTAMVAQANSLPNTVLSLLR